MTLLRPSRSPGGKRSSDPVSLSRLHSTIPVKKDQAVKLLNAVVANKAEFTEKADAQKLLDELGKT